MVIHDDHYALTVRFFTGGKSYGIDEVERAVSRKSSRWPHTADENDGLFRFHNEVEKVRCFLKRIGTVCDDDAIRVLVCKEGIDAASEGKPIVDREF